MPDKTHFKLNINSIMKSIFTLIFAILMAVSSFSQSESLLASVEIISAPEMEMEKDTTFVVSDDSLDFSESMDDKYSWLIMAEFEFDSLETSTNYPSNIEKITYTEKFDFSVSDIERTPDSVKEFVESVNDSTLFLAETDSGFVALNSFDGIENYNSIILADTIKINDKSFVFDSTHAANIKKFLKDFYFVVDSKEDTVYRMINFVSGYTEDEELAMLARYEEEMVQNESVSAVDKKSIIYVDQKEEAQVYFASYSLVEEVSGKHLVKESINSVEEGKEYSAGEIFFIIFTCVTLIIFLLLPIVTIAFGKKILPYLSHSEKRLVVKWEVSFMRHLRKKRKPPYYTEPAEEDARVPSS